MGRAELLADIVHSLEEQDLLREEKDENVQERLALFQSFSVQTVPLRG